MQAMHFTVLLLIICVCCLAVPGAGRTLSNDRHKQGVFTQTGSPDSDAVVAYGVGGQRNLNFPNGSAVVSGRLDNTRFCTRHRDMKLLCYCTPEENYTPVVKAECWVFSDTLLQNDTTWMRFFQQKRLRDLRLIVQNHGHLDYIPSMILESLENLTSISLEYAQVKVVQSYAFVNLTQLERIALNNNHIMALDKNAFANHLRLWELNLEHNQIIEIDRNAFTNLPLCERLLLDNNNLISLHEGLFRDTPNLVYLNLANNSISVLTSGIFKGLDNLNVLKLTRNNLNFIADTVFTELWSLTQLELDDNRIEQISERALDGLNNLKTLNLRNNLLKKIDSGLFRGAPALLSINLQENELESLTFFTFQPIMDNLVNSTSELLISDNNFVCDCRLQWIFDLRNRTRHTQLHESLESIVCTLQPPLLSNFMEPVPNHILNLINLADNASVHSTNVILVKNRSAQKRILKRQIGPIEAIQTKLIDQDKSRQRIQKKRRSLSNDIGSTTTIPNVVDKRAPDISYTEYRVHKENLQTDYYKAEHIALENGLDSIKQDALFPLLNDAVASDNEESGADNNVPPTVNKQSMGIKVQLFMLRVENLPCNDDIADPSSVEPRSRDLLDVRTSLPSNSYSIAGFWRLAPTTLTAFTLCICSLSLHLS